MTDYDFFYPVSQILRQAGEIRIEYLIKFDIVVLVIVIGFVKTQCAFIGI